MLKRNNREQLISEFVVNLLISFGENTSREGLVGTPHRVFGMYEELLGGYSQDPDSVFKTFKNNGYQDLVTLTNIDFYSFCEHHLIPFFGKIHIGYVPNGKILGLSKFARLTEILSHRLQTQENLTNQIVNTLEKHLQPRGLIVSIEAEHLCISMRGVKKSDCLTKTTAVRGILKNKTGLVNRFYREIGRSGKPI